MAEFDSIENVAQEIKNKLNSNTNKKSIALLYAFNATWKTRLSNEFNSLNDELDNDEIEEMIDSWDTLMEPKIKVLCYNAFLEDLFRWENVNFVLEFKSHWVIDFIQEQDLENNIKNIYINITNSKIEPNFNYEDESINFPIITTWDDGVIHEENIKVSKSEESILIWSIFYSILEVVIEALNTDKLEDRITNKFDNLEYIVIDDPVSSIDDARIITIADKLFQTIKWSNNKQLNFLLTTHHALFYNVLFNSFRWIGKAEAKKYNYILSKNSNNKLELKWQDDDTPFAYHLLIINRIKEVIDNWDIEKYHFNLFRTLLEKTANFLGYSKSIDCLSWDKKEEFHRVINLYSHWKLSEMENNEPSNEEKELLIETFNWFLENFKYN